MMFKLRVSSPLLLGLFPSSESMQEIPGAADGSPCPGPGAGPDSAQAVTSLSMGSWGSRKRDGALVGQGDPAQMHPLCFGNGLFRDSETWMSHVDNCIRAGGDLSSRSLSLPLEISLWVSHSGKIHSLAELHGTVHCCVPRNFIRYSVSSSG